MAKGTKAQTPMRQRVEEEKALITDVIAAPALPIVQQAYKNAGRNLVKTGLDRFDVLSQTGTKERAGIPFSVACQWLNNGFKS